MKQLILIITVCLSKRTPLLKSGIESFALVQLETNVAPPEVTELSSPDVMEEKCGSTAICFVAFLPDILDSNAEGRNKYLETLLSIVEKFKRSLYRGFVKTAGLGGKGILPLEGKPTVVKTEQWDGKDGEIIEEDEFSLDELMGDVSGEKDEL